MDRSHDINSVLAVSSGLIDDLSEEFLAGIILAEVVLVSVQTVFRQFYVACNAEYKLFQALAYTILNYGIVFCVHADTLNDRNIQDCDTGLNGKLLQ